MQILQILASYMISGIPITPESGIYHMFTPFQYQIEHVTLCLKYANKKWPSWI